MPGLFGVVDRGAAESEPRLRDLSATVRRMAAAMMYGPYEQSIVSCGPAGAAAGHVGFSTPVFATGLPGPVIPVVVAAGERAPDGSLLAGLVGHTGGSVEALVGRLAPTCAGFIADPAGGQAVLFNDRHGRERVFVHVDGTRTYFASEAKAILAVAPRTRAFDPAGVAEMMACGATFGARSLFRGIEVLPPGTRLTFDDKGCHRSRTFDRAELEGLEAVSENDFISGFSERLGTAVNRAIRDDQRVAVSLTGGLDSRMIMASLDAPAGSVPCYTFGSMYRTTGDVAVAAAVARSCGQPHRVLELGSPFLSRARDTHAESVYISDGYLGLSGAAELDVNRQARLVAPARMTGNWGGELMRGVRAFKFKAPKGSFYTPEFAAHIEAAAPAFSRPPAHPVSAALFDQIPSQGYGRYTIERSQVLMRSPFLDESVVRWLYRAPDVVRGGDGGAASVIRRRPALLSIPTDIGLLGQGQSGLRRFWRKGLVKAEYMTSHGAPHWLAKVASSLPAPLLETMFLGVDKFQHFRYWTRRDLAGYVRETLMPRHSDALSAWFAMPMVARMVEDHVAGRANYMEEIDRLLTLETASRVLFRRFEADA
jgi:asparagine synthase (glutamine-hydrolysing)